MVSDAARHHPVSLTRHVRAEMESFEQDFGLRRLEAAVNLDDDRAARWLKKGLGFHLERGVVRNYGIDGIGDYAMYVRVH